VIIDTRKIDFFSWEFAAVAFLVIQPQAQILQLPQLQLLQLPQLQILQLPQLQLQFQN
jgi:hypothetical protein